MQKGMKQLETLVSEWSVKRRDPVDIVKDILEVAKNGTLKTRIMFKANLSATGVNQYLSFMMENKLLRKNNDDCKPVYYTSEEGLTFLKGYNRLVQLLQWTR